MKKYSLLICLIAMIHNATNATRIAEVADSLDSSMAADSTEVIQLDGVEIVAAREIHKGDHDVLFLSEDNRKFGTNALDAISSLNRFETMLNSRTLTNRFREEVFILINGIPSGGDALRTYKGEYIKKVEYYSVAPTKYAIFTSGPIINVITNKKRDQQYDGYFSASNAINTGFGFNQASLTYTDSLNMVKVGYWVSYRNIGRISEHSEFNYDLFGRKTEYDTRRRYEGTLHNISTEYQRYQGKHLFNVSVTGKINPGEENSSGTANIFEKSQTYNGTQQSHLKSRANSITGDLYYAYMTGQTTFAMSVSNSFGKSYSDAWSEMVLPEPYSQYGYRNNSRLDNNSYAFGTYAMINTPWRWIGGDFSAAVVYNYSQIEQQILDTKITPSNNSLFINTGISWNVNGFFFNERLGASVNKQDNGLEKRTIFSPILVLYGNYYTLSRKNLNIQANFSIAKREPKLGDLSESISYRDNWFVATGNPDLQTSWNTSGGITVSFFNPNNSNNNIFFKYGTTYIDNVRDTYIAYENDIVTSKKINYTYWYANYLYLTGTWCPFKWLELSPYIEYRHERTSLSGERMTGKHFRFGGSVVLKHNNLSLILAANSSGRNWNAVVTERFSAQFAAVAQYKWRNWAFGAEWHYFDHNNYESGSINGFNYKIISDFKPLHNLVQLNVVYSFSVGRSRRHAQKQISGGEADSGLNQYNQVTND